MEPAAATTATSPSARRCSEAWEEHERVLRRVEELEVEVVRLRSEKKAAERAAAALTAELEADHGAAETAATEAMLMIERLQREKSAAMIEAREFRWVAGIRAARERELHDQLAEACALAASYQAILRAHGIDDDPDAGGDKAKGVVIEEASTLSSSSPPAAAKQAFEDKYAVDVRLTTKPVDEERVTEVLCARVEALEADSAAVRREVAAMGRAERPRLEVPARRRCRDDDAAEKQQSFLVLNVFKVLVLLPNIMGNETVCICGKVNKRESHLSFGSSVFAFPPD
ncbi:hypothetical protein HU200_057623 [Digitaria exilis]|uniref:GTD-binding domain-containing protein n=1 Tax=Digitaria exilis TaxID=1010633 RepID=A0A835E477_9POAL|nr:hypothetical protein HU200_057623 [Digitaria exilis]